MEDKLPLVPAHSAADDTSYNYFQANDIANDPKFHALIRERRIICISLTMIMLTAYFSFILIIAFKPSLLAIPVAAGFATTWGILVGFGMFALTFLLVAIYVRRANQVHDSAIAEIRGRAL